MPIAHVSLPVRSLDAATTFYLEALKPLGYGVFIKLEQTVGLTIKYDGPDFWLHQCHEMKEEDKLMGMHVAFKGKNQKAVKEFYEAALKAGGKDNGPPGERKYTKGYYAAYVLDLDGNNLEAVFYHPWWLSALQSLSYVVPALLGATGALALGWWLGN